MDEWQHLTIQRKALICGGDFSSHTTLWGYEDEDLLTEHLIGKNLAITNMHKMDANFEKLDSAG